MIPCCVSSLKLYVIFKLLLNDSTNSGYISNTCIKSSRDIYVSKNYSKENERKRERKLEKKKEKREDRKKKERKMREELMSCIIVIMSCDQVLEVSRTVLDT